ncbi:armadillo-type protein [Suillus plorans]|uniref:Armadillo-type protein n=1 Tax=Suillus plorans TaxID=116603 RepID=A0A9P7J7A5_9AGAM|nr:armadillo-type protein [Suillus plorans]KAG1806317.1 armadillo-type protein [Suillus plorans]
MADDSLLVPVLLANGSLHHPSVSSNALAQDIIGVLTAQEEVLSSVLGELQDTGWALQHVCSQPNGRKWEEAELEALGDGIIDPSTPIAPLLKQSNYPVINASQRHFSTFPLTSHLHSPTLRLVSLHAALSLSLSFARVPEIHDGFTWTVYYARSSIVEDVIRFVVEDLGLTKSLPMAGGGNLEYIIQDGASRISSSSVLSDLVQSYLTNSRQKPTFQFCVPEEWYLRPRALLPFSVQPSEDTLKRFEDIQAESDDAEGTAKQKKSTLDALMANASTARPASPDWRGSITSLFAWQQPAPPASPPPSLSKKRMSVSDPVLVEQRTGGSIMPVTQSSILEDEILEVDQAEFERCLDHMALKGDARDKMYILTAAKKRQIIDQARALHSTLDGRTPRPSQSRQSTLEVSGGGAFLPRLVPQLTGDSGILKRLSMVTWGTSAAVPPVMSPALNRSSGEFDKVAETMQPLQAQTAGSMFGNWWASSGGEKNTEAESTISAKRYVDGLRNMKADARLVKHLISLRVHLSTAKLPWIEEFIIEDGMNAIGSALAALVGKGGKRTVFADIESTVLLEIIKCLRVLLNTQAGFDSVLSSPTIIIHIAYSFYGASLKTRMLAAELLAAICVLSPNQGHKAVIAASSEYRIAYDELYRFEFLVAALGISDQSNDTAANNTSSHDEDGIWEARTAFMALVNALTNCPESLEDRILLREEFGRRGLNEVIVTLRYTKPPDSLLTQLDLYTEEKYEDEEDLRERTRNAVRGGQGYGIERSESDIFLDDLLQSANNVGLGSISMSILHHLSSIMKGDAELNVKVDQLAIVDTFLDHIFTADDIDLGWIPLITRFLDAIRPITGQDIIIDAVDGGTKRELENLRVQIDDLIQTNSALKTRLEQRTGSNQQKPNTSSKGGNENKLVQRLMQKEKEVTQLQAELERLNSQISNNAHDVVGYVNSHR